MTTYTLISADFTRFSARQRDVLKVAAFAAMVLDHLNTASELNATLLQAVGRLAFPLFALVWGYNVVRRPVTQAGLPSNVQCPLRGRDDVVRSAAEPDYPHRGLPSCATGESASRWPVVCATLCPASDLYHSQVISLLNISGRGNRCICDKFRLTHKLIPFLRGAGLHSNSMI